LSNCASLTKIDLSPLSKVTEIRKYFLIGCISLKEIDLSQLPNLEYIGFSIFDEFSSLESIKILPHQQPIILEPMHSRHTILSSLEQKLEINTEWYNTSEGKIWVENILQQSKNIQNSDFLLEIIDFL
jgi:hypothetical protein